LETTAGLDCKIQSEYAFKMMARDSDNQTGVLNVTLIVEDINDNSPQFDSPKYMFKVITGQIAGTMSASHNNADLNSLVTFSTVTSSSNTPLSVNNIRKDEAEIVVERTMAGIGTFIITVVGTDDGGKKSSAGVTVTINP